MATTAGRALPRSCRAYRTMNESLLAGDDGAPRVRRASAGNLTAEDPEAEEKSRRGSTPGVPAVRPPGAPPSNEAFVDIEDALDKIGGFGLYQWLHCFPLVLFWMMNVGTLVSVYGNSPWCVAEDDPQLCLQADEDVPKSPEVFWSDCRSVSCQFNIRPALCIGADDGAGAACALNGDADGCAVDGGDCAFTAENELFLRPLFDSLFFLGWMWSVPFFGWLADHKGRRWALFGSWTILMISTVAAAVATTPTFYLVARHFNGVGFGSVGLSSYVLGTEIAPRKTATAVKTWWAVFSSLGQVLISLVLRALLFLPGYNWRILTLVSIIPIFLAGIAAFLTVDESPRWVLIARGETEAKYVLRPQPGRHLLSLPFLLPRYAFLEQHFKAFSLCCCWLIFITSSGYSLAVILGIGAHKVNLAVVFLQGPAPEDCPPQRRWRLPRRARFDVPPCPHEAQVCRGRLPDVLHARPTVAHRSDLHAVVLKRILLLRPDTRRQRPAVRPLFYYRDYLHGGNPCSCSQPAAAGVSARS